MSTGFVLKPLTRFEVTTMQSIRAAAIALTLISAGFSSSQTRAAVELSTYMDANGFIDVQKLTCAQLANTHQEDADMLAAWYNGLAKKHFAHFTRAKSGEHQLILDCKSHPEARIIQAVDILMKNERRK
jgi:hypothetical protein